MDYRRITVTRRPGKWLEWIHIKVTGGMRVSELLPCSVTAQLIDHVPDPHTEWHKLQVRSAQRSHELRNNLCAMLDLFPQWNRWEEIGASNGPTSDFENLVDETWSYLSGEAIARFIN